MIAGCAAGTLLALSPYVNAHGGSVATRLLWVSVALMVQLRLLANLFDGMVAIQTNRASPVGELYNELPDRVSDAAILIGAGYAIGGSAAAGYVAALLAVATAYVRAVGKSSTGLNDYCGPMAKPQRMAVVTVGCLLLAVLPSRWWAAWGPHAGIMAVVTVIVALGSAATCVRRTVRIARVLRDRESGDE